MNSFLKQSFTSISEHLFTAAKQGYWSNLDRKENDQLIESLKTLSTRDAIRKHHPRLFDVIFSEDRFKGVNILELKGTERCVDFGCMWGALTVPLAKKAAYVLGVDQTLDSLRFLDKRMKEQEISNYGLLCSDLRTLPDFTQKFDVAIVNGVLEWIPEQGDIQLSSYFGKVSAKQYSESPIEAQRKFLAYVWRNLAPGGRLYLAIENRFDYHHFFGIRDPHAGLPWLPILPRPLASALSQLQLKRPYVNWIYSFAQMQKLLGSAGFSAVDKYVCFPDYRFPEYIAPFEQRLKDFQLVGAKSLKKKLVQTALFKTLKLSELAPSIIMVAKK